MSHIKMEEERYKKQKGASLYFALITLSILMLVVFGISTIIVIQVGTIRRAGDSVIAFYAADAGIERALYGIKLGELSIGDSLQEYLDLDIAVRYDTSILATTSPECPPGTVYYCIKSIGTYEDVNTRRGIQVNR